MFFFKGLERWDEGRWGRGYKALGLRGGNKPQYSRASDCSVPQTIATDPSTLHPNPFLDRFGAGNS